MLSPRIAGARARRWNTGHVRGCPMFPLDWPRTLYMQACYRSGGVSLRALVDMARPGDLLLMSGRGPLACIQEIFTDSIWSHVGTVVRYNNVTCISHATNHNNGVVNYLGGAGAVRIQPLYEFLTVYLDEIGLDVALRRLRGVDDDARDAAGRTERDRINEALVREAEDVKDRRFQPDAATFVAVRYPVIGAALHAFVVGLAYAGIRLPSQMIHDHHLFIYCTQHFTRGYVAAGVFDRNAEDTQIAPGNLSDRASPSHTVLDLAACDFLPWADSRFYLDNAVYIHCAASRSRRRRTNPSRRLLKNSVRSRSGSTSGRSCCTTCDQYAHSAHSRNGTPSRCSVHIPPGSSVPHR